MEWKFQFPTSSTEGYQAAHGGHFKLNDQRYRMCYILLRRPLELIVQLCIWMVLLKFSSWKASKEKHLHSFYRNSLLLRHWHVQPAPRFGGVLPSSVENSQLAVGKPCVETSNVRRRSITVKTCFPFHWHSLRMCYQESHKHFQTGPEHQDAILRYRELSSERVRQQLYKLRPCSFTCSDPPRIALQEP